MGRGWEEEGREGREGKIEVRRGGEGNGEEGMGGEGRGRERRDGRSEGGTCLHEEWVFEDSLNGNVQEVTEGESLVRGLLA